MSIPTDIDPDPRQFLIEILVVPLLTDMSDSDSSKGHGFHKVTRETQCSI